MDSYVIVVFAWVDGVFNRYHEKDPIVNNDTYIEPYTKTIFKKWLHRNETASSELFHLIGVGLRTKKVPVIGITVKVYAIGLYVGYTEGRKELRKWILNKTNSQNSPNFDDDLADILTSGRIPLVFRMVQVGTPPKSHYQYDDWIGRMRLYLREQGESPEDISRDSKQFKSWFKNGFKKHDDYRFEWEIGKSNEYLRLTYNGKSFDRANGKMAYAFFKQELYQMKNRVINLIGSIFL